jgi:hypothetical protein
MKLNNGIILSLLLLLTASVAASPYESLSFALRQQKIINDLRSHCRIDKAMPDEKIKTVFLNNAATQTAIVSAATALRKQDHEGYRHAVDEIECPDFT